MIKKALRKFYKRVRPYLKEFDDYMGEDLREHIQPVQTFSYRKPGDEKKGSKEFVLLGKNKNIRGAVHILREGAEEHLHSHQTIDGFWFVLSGKARFHGDGGKVHGEFGKLEGILIPRNTRYWFESVSEHDLELLQILAIDPEQGWHRQNYASPNYDKKTVKHFDARLSDKNDSRPSE